MNARQSAPPLPPVLGKATVFGFSRLSGTPALHPLQGERQVRPSPAETGEGSSGQPLLGYAKVSPERKSRAKGLPRTHPRATHSHSASSPLPPSPLRERAGVRVAATPTTHPKPQQPPAITRPLLLPLPMGEGWGEGLPPTHPWAALASWKARLVFTLSEGRGRFRRLRRKSVRGLPRTQPQVTQAPANTRPLFLPLPAVGGPPAKVSRASTRVWNPMFKRRGALHPLQGERQVRPSPAETGEGSSGQPTSGYAKVSPEHEGRSEGLPRTQPQCTFIPSPHSPLAPTPLSLLSPLPSPLPHG